MKSDGVLFVRWISIILFSISGCAFSGQAALPPGTTPVDAARLKDGVLSVPAIEGTVAAPSAEWSWFQGVASNQGVEIYYCLGPENQFFVVTFSPGLKKIRTAKVEYFTNDVEGLVKPSNGSILSEKGEFVSLPPHAEVFHMTSRVRMGEMELDYERYLMPASKHMVLFGAVPITERDRAAFKTFAATLRYPPTHETDKHMYIYFLLAAIFYVLGAIINSAMKRTVIGAAVLSLISVGILLVVRIVMIKTKLMLRPGPSDDFNIGQEIGMALIPFVVLMFMISREKKAEREAAERAKAQRELELLENEEEKAREAQAERDALGI